ncbi:rRNA bioproteinsis protein rrp5 [Savitreella phatthalungensis]
MAPVAETKKRKRESTGTPSTALPTTQTRPATLTSKTEVAAFPRGGGSSLTPLEYKEATQEARREAFLDDGEDEDVDDNDISRGSTGAIATKSNKSKKRKSGGTGKKPVDGTVQHAAGLSYKRATQGTQVLGQISAVNNDDLVIALPNNLLGFVSLVEVSDELAKLVEGVDDSDNDDDMDLPDLPKLTTLFAPGQYLRTSVIASTPQQGKDASKKNRIDLTLKPSVVNAGHDRRTVQKNALVQVSVRSVEDHGIVVETGIEGSTGFIKSKQLGETKLKEGQVTLCRVLEVEKNGKVLQLTPAIQNNATKLRVKELVDVRALLPGDCIDVVPTDEQEGGGFVGRAFGLQDVTCDPFHARQGLKSGSVTLGQRIPARVLFCNDVDGERKVAVSILSLVLNLKSPSADATKAQNPSEALPYGTVLDSVTITSVVPHLGLWANVGLESTPGFVHISRIADDKVKELDATSGNFKIGSRHAARVVGFNALDGVLSISTEPSVVQSKLFSTADLHVGQLVKGKVEAVRNGAVFVRLSKSLVARVPELHVADVKLQFPEQKFKVGSDVKGKILSLDPTRQNVNMTMKKSWINVDTEDIVSELSRAALGKQTQAVISKLLDKGALVDFYGNTKAFLPVSQMSEAHIADPREHFRVGQTVNVRVIEVDVERRRMVVSCKAGASVDVDTLRSAEIGAIVACDFTDKTKDHAVVSVHVEGEKLTGSIEAGHFADGDEEKGEKAFKRIRVGGHLKEAVIIGKNVSQGQLILSAKPSLVRAAKGNTLLKELEDAKVGFKYAGSIAKVYDYGVLVQFVHGLTGLCLKSELAEEYIATPASVFRPSQSIEATVTSVDAAQRKLLVSFREKPTIGSASNGTAVNDLVQAKIIGIRQTQLNLELPNGMHGRVDVSSIFDSADDIRNKRHPLKGFQAGATITVRIIGRHDPRTHKFLPLTHRMSNASTMAECSLKPSAIADADAPVLTLRQVKKGKIYLGFVNKVADDSVWVSLSPSVRGRVKLVDLADLTTGTQSTGVDQAYVPGQALNLRVINIDIANDHLDLSERAVDQDVIAITSLKSLKIGQQLPGRVTKVLESGLLVQLSESVVGRVSLTDIADEDIADPTSQVATNAVVSVTVKAIDLPNKRLSLSLRDPAPNAKDPEINAVADLKEGATYRGYIKNVADHGLFVELGRNVTARVKIAELSDDFVKDWRRLFTIHQLVEGRVLSVDTKSSRVEFSLRKTPSGKTARNTSADAADLSMLSKGDIVDATVKKIETFGIFLTTTDHHIDGLCHKSQVADKAVGDLAKIYSPGDLVRAIVLEVDEKKRRVSFGLKASYFDDNEQAEDDEDEDEDDGEVDMDDADNDDAEFEEDDEEEEEEEEDDDGYVDEDESMEGDADAPAVKAGGFDLDAGDVFGDNADESDADSSDDDEAGEVSRKNKKRKNNRQVKSIDDEPTTPEDFERLVLGDPNNSLHWVRYMAYYLESSDVGRARSIAERALGAIHYRELSEKLNVYNALLNLECSFGDEDTLEAVFKRACTSHDPRDMHARLAGVYIRAGKNAEAEEIFKKAVQRFGSTDPRVWQEYADWLARQQDRIDDARSVYARSFKSLPERDHVAHMERFARLEYHLGEPERGATLFEGLLASYPKKLDVWFVYIDQEVAAALRQAKAEGIQPIRDVDDDDETLGDEEDVDALRLPLGELLTPARKLFVRVLDDASPLKLSVKKAKSVFKKWLALEKKHGSEDDVERVKARAVAFVESH